MAGDLPRAGFGPDFRDVGNFGGTMRPWLKSVDDLLRASPVAIHLELAEDSDSLTVWAETAGGREKVATFSKAAGTASSTATAKTTITTWLKNLDSRLDPAGFPYPA